MRNRFGFTIMIAIAAIIIGGAAPPAKPDIPNPFNVDAMALCIQPDTAISISVNPTEVATTIYLEPRPTEAANASATRDDEFAIRYIAPDQVLMEPTDPTCDAVETAIIMGRTESDPDGDRTWNSMFALFVSMPPTEVAMFFGDANRFVG